jgi:hypothetical protein
VGRCGLDASGSGYGPADGPYEHGNETFGLIKAMNFLSSWVTISFSKRSLLYGVS